MVKIGCETANQQFNWIGDLRVEKATQRTIENDRIYKGMYNGELCVARKMTIMVQSSTAITLVMLMEFTEKAAESAEKTVTLAQSLIAITLKLTA